MAGGGSQRYYRNSEGGGREQADMRPSSGSAEGVGYNLREAQQGADGVELK